MEITRCTGNRFLENILNDTFKDVYVVDENTIRDIKG
jgi:hypothetical protein